MANDFTPPDMKNLVMQQYYQQGQPIEVPFRGGTVRIDPRNPCIQQYIER